MPCSIHGFQACASRGIDTVDTLCGLACDWDSPQPQRTFGSVAITCDCNAPDTTPVPTTAAPSAAPSMLQNQAPASPAPSDPPTVLPTQAPASSVLSGAPTTLPTTTAPITRRPSIADATSMPTLAPITPGPTRAPSLSLLSPATEAPTVRELTLSPSLPPSAVDLACNIDDCTNDPSFYIQHGACERARLTASTLFVCNTRAATLVENSQFLGAGVSFECDGTGNLVSRSCEASTAAFRLLIIQELGYQIGRTVEMTCIADAIYLTNCTIALVDQLLPFVGSSVPDRRASTTTRGPTAAPTPAPTAAPTAAATPTAAPTPAPTSLAPAPAPMSPPSPAPSRVPTSAPATPAPTDPPPQCIVFDTDNLMAAVMPMLTPLYATPSCAPITPIIIGRVVPLLQENSSAASDIAAILFGLVDTNREDLCNCFAGMGSDGIDHFFTTPGCLFGNFTPGDMFQMCADVGVDTTDGFCGRACIWDNAERTMGATSTASCSCDGSTAHPAVSPTANPTTTPTEHPTASPTTASPMETTTAPPTATPTATATVTGTSPGAPTSVAPLETTPIIIAPPGSSDNAAGSSDNVNDDESNTSAVIGAVIAVLVLLGLIFGVIVVMKRRERMEELEMHMSPFAEPSQFDMPKATVQGAVHSSPPLESSFPEAPLVEQTDSAGPVVRNLQLTDWGDVQDPPCSPTPRPTPRPRPASTYRAHGESIEMQAYPSDSNAAAMPRPIARVPRRARPVSFGDEDELQLDRQATVTPLSPLRGGSAAYPRPVLLQKPLGPRRVNLRPLPVDDEGGYQSAMPLNPEYASHSVDHTENQIDAATYETVA